MSRSKPSARSESPELSPEELATEQRERRALARMVYERGRLKGTGLRKYEKARRKAKLPPPTLDEAIRDHWAAKYGSRTVAAALDEVDELASLEAAYVEPQAQPRPTSSFLIDRTAENAAALREALALPLRERLSQYGYLVGLPFECDIPDSLLSDEARWELPAWSLAAKFDAVRDDFFIDLVSGTTDESALNAELSKRGIRARSVRPDEVNLDAKQRAHLRRLRVKVKQAKDILVHQQRLEAPLPRVARAQSYVDAAEAAIKAARVAYGLAPEE